MTKREQEQRRQWVVEDAKDKFRAVARNTNNENYDYWRGYLTAALTMAGYGGIEIIREIEYQEQLATAG